jgi:uncharacterized membrane protein
MITEASIEIDAPAAVVWDTFVAVEQWPEMTASVTSLEGVDGPEVAVGRRFRIKQPRLPKVTWTVSELTPGRSWTWVSKTPGNTTSATHELEALGENRTLVKQRIDQSGPGGWLVGHLMRRTTVRYLAMEGEGLKALSERAAHT